MYRHRSSRVLPKEHKIYNTCKKTSWHHNLQNPNPSTCIIYYSCTNSLFYSRCLRHRCYTIMYPDHMDEYEQRKREQEALFFLLACLKRYCIFSLTTHFKFFLCFARQNYLSSGSSPFPFSFGSPHGLFRSCSQQQQNDNGDFVGIMTRWRHFHVERISIRTQ